MLNILLPLLPFNFIANTKKYIVTLLLPTYISTTTAATLHKNQLRVCTAAMLLLLYVHENHLRVCIICACPTLF